MCLHDACQILNIHVHVNVVIDVIQLTTMFVI